MKLEHTGIAVAEPIKMAQWYETQLGCKILKTEKGPDMETAFITDGEIVLELLTHAGIAPLSSLVNNPSQLHLAFLSDDPERDCERLTAAGAVFQGEAPVKRAGETLLFLKDPFGNTIQLVKRRQPLF